MDWTVGTCWTMGNDALATGDRLWTAWTPGTPIILALGLRLNRGPVVDCLDAGD